MECILACRCMKILADKASRQTFRKVWLARFASRRIALRLYSSAMYSAGCVSYHFNTADGHRVFGNENMYFLRDYFTFDENTVLLDAGAFTGDSIREYIQYAQVFKAAYCIEPLPENFVELEGATDRFELKEKIRLFLFALSGRNATVRFHPDGSASRFSETGDIFVQSVNALEFLQSLNPKPTFIKMDIEGSEMEVLRTIEPWLRKEKPDLAVSIYHETAHLYRIPLLINHIVPEYRIFIRHNSNDFTETVCYATIHKKPFTQDESYTD